MPLFRGHFLRIETDRRNEKWVERVVKVENEEVLLEIVSPEWIAPLSHFLGMHMWWSQEAQKVNPEFPDYYSDKELREVFRRVSKRLVENFSDRGAEEGITGAG